MKYEEVAQPEEQEATVLEDLVNNIKKAAKATLAHSDEPTCATAPDGEGQKTNLAKRHVLGFLL